MEEAGRGDDDIHPVRMFSKHTSNAASACEVKTVRCSPTMSLGLPYSLPTASKIWERGELATSEGGTSWTQGHALSLTCMLTCMPSPLVPSTVAVTTTRVSLATKFRTHRLGLLPLLWAWRSNLSAFAKATNSSTLQAYCSSDRGGAMVAGWCRWYLRMLVCCLSRRESSGKEKLGDKKRTGNLSRTGWV